MRTVRPRFPLLVYTLLFVAAIDIVFASLFYVVEGGLTFVDSLYWSVITTSTVGYGDITPHTEAGRMVAVAAAVSGVVSYMLLISALTELFLSIEMRKELGLFRVKEADVVVITEDQHIAKEIFSELKARYEAHKISLLTPIEWKTRPEGVSYIIGSPIEIDDLNRAGVKGAKAVMVVLNDESKAIHTILLVRHLNKKAKIAARAISMAAIHLLQEAGADFIAHPAITARLLASYLAEKYTVKAVEDLSDSSRGARLRELRTPRDIAHLKFCEAARILKETHGHLLVGHVKDDVLYLNPGCEETLDDSQRILVIEGEGIIG